MRLSLDGNDWRLLPLIPSEYYWHKVWREDFDPLTSHVPCGTWMPATVPGDVISDSLDAGLIADPRRDMQSRLCEWLSLRDWVYRKDFTVPPEFEGRSLHLRFSGVDHACLVYLNGELLGEHEGMFLPFEFDVTPKVRTGTPNVLVVVVYHAPPVDDVQGQVGWTNQTENFDHIYSCGD